LGVSLYNTQKLSSGLVGPEHFGLFDTVTQEQFTATVLGFLTYRLPLFVGQLRDAFQQIAVEDARKTKTGGRMNGSGSSSATLLPGSVGVAAQLLSKNQKNSAAETTLVTDNTVTVLLVSGPQATGRSELVAQLLASGSNENRLVRPQRLQRKDDGATFERLQQRGEFFDLPQASSSFETTSDSSGFTAAGIFAAAQGMVTMETETETEEATATSKMIPNQNVVVIDADIDVVQRIRASSALPNVRIIGIWIGLQSVEEFETNLRARIATGTLSSSLSDKEADEETDPERLVRSKMKEIVQEIEYGLGSGIFEFTILNDGGPTSLQELQEAATYAFK